MQLWITNLYYTLLSFLRSAFKSKSEKWLEEELVAIDKALGFTLTSSRFPGDRAAQIESLVGVASRAQAEINLLREYNEDNAAEYARDRAEYTRDLDRASRRIDDLEDQLEVANRKLLIYMKFAEFSEPVEISEPAKQEGPNKELAGPSASTPDPDWSEARAVLEAYLEEMRQKAVVEFSTKLREGQEEILKLRYTQKSGLLEDTPPEGYQRDLDELERLRAARGETKPILP